MKKVYNDRLGEVNINNYGSKMEVVEYNHARNVWIKFEQGNLVNTYWENFCNGSVKNCYDKSVFGVGYIGEGEFSPTRNGKQTPQYKIWTSMLGRCYDEKIKSKLPTYKDCTVDESWHNFQNFANWYEENFYKIEGERMHLDKDILVKGNKIYSPNTCVFVPQRINSLFVKRDANRGDLPIGVSSNKSMKKDKNNKKYIVKCGIEGGRDYLGSYDTIEEAFQVYKIYKEKLIKSIAIDYREKIPNKLYNAMINYIVEISD